MRNIKKIVFVCTGNTCRSPMAEALARDEAMRRGLSVEVGSAGIDALAGDRASDLAIVVCSEVGLDIREHVAQMLTEDDIESDTLYVAMTRQHLSWLRFVLMVPAEQVYLLGNGISDPYGRGIDDYRTALSEIAVELEKLFERIGCVLPKATDAPVEQRVLRYVIEPIADDTVSEASMLENRCFPDPWSLAMLTEEMDNPDACFLVAVGDESATGGRKRAVYGYGGIIVAADVALIPKICVAQSLRRRGIANALIKALGEEARRRGATELTLEVRVSNSPAIKLYEKLGFVSMGIRPDFYTKPHEDALIMTKQLGEWADEVAEAEEAAETEETAETNETAEAVETAETIGNEAAAAEPLDAETAAVAPNVEDAADGQPEESAPAESAESAEPAEPDEPDEPAEPAEPDEFADIPEEYGSAAPAPAAAYDEDDDGMMIIFPDTDDELYDEPVQPVRPIQSAQPAQPAQTAQPQPIQSAADTSDDADASDDEDDEDDGGIIFIFPEDE